MTKKKIAIAIAAAALAGTCAIGGTLAWLTAESDKVTNTFSFGNVSIKLDETKVGVPGERTTQNTYHIIPEKVNGEVMGKADKDPQVHISSSSEKCYVFAYVDNQFADGIAELNIDNSTWESVDEKPGLYVYVGSLADDDKVVDPSNGKGTTDEIMDIYAGYISLENVFTQVTFPQYQGNIAPEDAAKYNKNINVKAFAIQSDNINYTDAVDEAYTTLTSTGN